MNRTLLEELIKYFSEIKNPDDEEKQLLMQLESEKPYFKITSVSREDLKQAGFDVSEVSDADMYTLARKMADDYCEQLFWTSLGILAEDYLYIPKDRNRLCPLCEEKSINYDIERNIYRCEECETEWFDTYVLVEYPEDTDHFEEKSIGYPCFNSEDNGACYVPEYDYIKHYRKRPSKEKYFNPVSWPESQEYMDNPECEAIIADEKGLEDFGPCAYWVPLTESLHKNNNL
jgi:hypothetical protein